MSLSVPTLSTLSSAAACVAGTIDIAARAAGSASAARRVTGAGMNTPWMARDGGARGYAPLYRMQRSR